MQEATKISKDIIENFEKHYKENVIQPTITLNGYGDIISYIYSENAYDKRCYDCSPNEQYVRRIYKLKSGNGLAGKYGMVYMELPNNKQIRYDYLFYDEQCEKYIQTFIHI